jgi:hypothetical protein
MTSRETLLTTEQLQPALEKARALIVATLDKLPGGIETINREDRLYADRYIRGDNNPKDQRSMDVSLVFAHPDECLRNGPYDAFNLETKSVTRNAAELQPRVVNTRTEIYRVNNAVRPTTNELSSTRAATLLSGIHVVSTEEAVFGEGSSKRTETTETLTHRIETEAEFLDFIGRALQAAREQ